MELILGVIKQDVDRKLWMYKLYNFTLGNQHNWSKSGHLYANSVATLNNHNNLQSTDSFKF